MTPKEIKELRRQLRLSQRAMAVKLGVVELTWRRWERGYFKPSPLALEKLRQLRDSLAEKVA